MLTYFVSYTYLHWDSGRRFSNAIVRVEKPITTEDDIWYIERKLMGDGWYEKGIRDFCILSFQKTGD